MSEIRDNLEIVRRRIEEACQRAGRDASEVTLIAVSKTKPVPMLEEAYEGEEPGILVKIRFRRSRQNMAAFLMMCAGI